MTTIIKFYRGETTDDRGRTLAEIRGWSLARLESTHDYIQWLFPLREASGVNPGAPLIDDETIRAFQQDSRLRAELLLSFEVMLRFFGLKLEAEPLRVVERPDFRERAEVWLGSHNLLRITRILGCLRTLGLEEYALAFYDYLAQLFPRERARIGVSFEYWRRAVAD